MIPVSAIPLIFQGVFRKPTVFRRGIIFHSRAAALPNSPI
jgi:hypothetical protein